MAAAVSDAELDLSRLIRILGMLGSASDHEALVAARKAHDWVQSHATTWRDLLDHLAIPPVLGVTVAGRPADAPQSPVHAAGGATPPPGTQTAQAPPGGSGAGWRAVAAEILLSHPHVLKGPRELDFVQSRVASRFPDLTQKQEDWLRDIARRAGLTW